MRARVVYESIFGNTRAIAEAIADGLRGACDVEVHEISAAPPEHRQIRRDARGEFDAEIEALMDELYRAPGFRLMRRQIGKLVGFAHGEWRRLRPEGGPQIRPRTFLAYVTRRPNSVKLRLDAGEARET